MAEITTILGALKAKVDILNLLVQKKVEVSKASPKQQAADPAVNLELRGLDEKLLSNTNTLETLEKILQDHSVQIEDLNEDFGF